MPLLNQSTEDYPLPTKKECSGFSIHEIGIGYGGRSGKFGMLKPPCKVSIRLKLPGKYVDGKYVPQVNRYTVALPWHFFAARIGFSKGARLSNAYMRFCLKPPKDLHDLSVKTAYCAVPNVFDDGRICYGRSRPWYKSRIDRYMEALYRNFWMVPFTSDILPNRVPKDFLGRGDENLHRTDQWKRILKSWESMTKDHEESQIDWRPYGKTVEEYFKNNV